MPWTVLGRINLHASLIHAVVSRSSLFTKVPRASRNIQINGNLQSLNCQQKVHWSSRPPLDATKTVNVNNTSQNQVRNYWKMSVQSTIDDLTQVCIDLRQSVKKASSQEQKEAIALKHIKTYAGTGLKINDFAKGLEWFNVSASLSLRKELNGKIVILDFFTYCCINCMHILPDLDALEKKYHVQDGLVIIGVHSAKFANERDSSKVLAAVQRYNIEHPVVNDAKLSMWRDIGITCWPSLVMIGPSGQPLFVLVGEDHREELFLYTKVALEYFKSLNQIATNDIPIELASHILPVNKNLLFPGKVHTFMHNSIEKIVISDTGNNRILIMDTNGKVEYVVGGFSPALADGDFESARFNAPQGVCVLGDDIYVADNENHAIRKISLRDQRVTTVAGTGVQGRDYRGGKIGTAQELSSPWDVAIYHHEQGDKTVPILLIAIAGTHQIWALFLEDTIWWKNEKHKAGKCINIVGNGREANRNNSYAHAASLAQPSGLAVSQEFKSVFFADSESSTVRRVCLDKGSVLPVCGADNNPSNLHCFGDVDGKKYSAKLQHPLGVAWNRSDMLVYIADTYNHKIKKTDSEGNCVTVCGGGKPSKDASVSSMMKNLLKLGKHNDDNKTKNDVAFQFDEPSGLAVSQDGKILYVADTNNHCIKAIELDNVQNIRIIEVTLPETVSTLSDYTYNFSSKVSTQDSDLSISFVPTFKNSDLKMNVEAQQKWSLDLLTSNLIASKLHGELSEPVTVKIPSGKEEKKITIMMNMMLCKTSEVCLSKKIRINYSILRDEGSPTQVTENKELFVKE
uniref:Thioredoxin domain-containing protein n=1 Tax=Trichogramma kaykai TaxID=54128 RepID=A0ABD2W380_9HYME